jgi:hypothetical protein
MFEILKNMFTLGKITETHILSALKKGWITTEEKDIILNK